MSWATSVCLFDIAYAFPSFAHHSPPWSLLCCSIHQLIPPPWSFTLLLLLPPKMPFPHVSPWLHLFSYSDSSLNITSPESIFLILSLNEHPTCLHSFFIMSLSIVFHSLSPFFFCLFSLVFDGLLPLECQIPETKNLGYHSQCQIAHPPIQLDLLNNRHSKIFLK